MFIIIVDILNANVRFFDLSFRVDVQTEKKLHNKIEIKILNFERLIVLSCALGSVEESAPAIKTLHNSASWTSTMDTEPHIAYILFARQHLTCTLKKNLNNAFGEHMNERFSAFWIFKNKTMWNKAHCKTQIEHVQCKVCCQSLNNFNSNQDGQG